MSGPDHGGVGARVVPAARRTGSMHVDQAGRHYTMVGGERRAYPTYLLRRSFRYEHGRPRKETSRT